MFEPKATEKRLDAEVKWLSRRIDNLEGRPYKAPNNYTLDALVNILEQAGILIEVEEENLKDKVLYNNKKYKVKKVK